MSKGRYRPYDMYEGTHQVTIEGRTGIIRASDPIARTVTVEWPGGERETLPWPKVDYPPISLNGIRL